MIWKNGSNESIDKLNETTDRYFSCIFKEDDVPFIDNEKLEQIMKSLKIGACEELMKTLKIDYEERDDDPLKFVVDSKWIQDYAKPSNLN